ncbi:MAG: phosphoesterase [Rhodospirillaceae bacterium]|nr:phosphoesterase [Rhodospirillaceae bacterium]
MTYKVINFQGETLHCHLSGALVWPSTQTVIVSDLHLEKGSAFAQRGILLPPYDSRDSLNNLAVVLKNSSANRVICLGDSFHDQSAFERLGIEEISLIQRMTTFRDWIWITGNHDPDPPTHLGGQVSMEFALGPITFRHIAKPQANMGEVSGHYHPKARVSVRGQYLSAPCFITDGKKLILPAFGAYTGGLDVTDPAIDVHFKKGYNVHLLGQQKVFSFPKNALSKKRRHEANMIL